MVDARKVKDMVAKKSSQFVGNIASAGKVSPHKHCRICQEAIPIKADPRVCKQQACIDQNEKCEQLRQNEDTWSRKQRNWNRRQLTITAFLIFGIP